MSAALMISCSKKQACPEGVDPVYCRVAQDTGGKVHASKDELLLDFEKNLSLTERERRFKRFSDFVRGQLFNVPIALPLVLSFFLLRRELPRGRLSVLYGLASSSSAVFLILFLSIGGAGSSALESFGKIALGIAALSAATSFLLRGARLPLLMMAVPWGLLPYFVIYVVAAIH